MEVDEVASQLMHENKVNDFIVVAIWNIPNLRHMDLYPKTLRIAFKRVKRENSNRSQKSQFPFDDSKINSDNYLKFIVEELKPYIDKKVFGFTTANQTAIMGSSMGGLISMYALCEYPNVFGKAACLSTHWIGFREFENNPIPESFSRIWKRNYPKLKITKYILITERKLWMLST